MVINGMRPLLVPETGLRWLAAPEPLLVVFRDVISPAVKQNSISTPPRRCNPSPSRFANHNSLAMELTAYSPSAGSDVEMQLADDLFLLNDTVKSISWENIPVTVQDRQTKQAKDILTHVNGSVMAGKDRNP